MQNTCIKEKLDETCARLETSPRKSFGMIRTVKRKPASPPQNAMKLLRLHPHDSCGSQTPQYSFAAKVVSMNWSHQGVHVQEFYPTLVLFSVESLFYIPGYVNCQNNV